MHQPTPPSAADARLGIDALSGLDESSGAVRRAPHDTDADRLSPGRQRPDRRPPDREPPEHRTAPYRLQSPGTVGRPPAATAGGSAPSQGSPGAPRIAGLPPTHTAMICVALPGLAISTEQGQLTGHGLEGFYRAGRRVLSRCQLRVAGREPLVVQARMTLADSARFVGTLRVTPHGGPDPDVVVERVRSADGTERITLRSTAARPLRLPVEVTLGTDLADLGAIAAGAAGPELPASVYDSGLRWSCAAGTSSVSAAPAPSDAIASAGLLRWEFDVPPGGSVHVELRVRLEGTGPVRAVGRAATSLLAPAQATGDDPRVRALLTRSVQDLQALLVRDPERPADAHLAAGAPWRCGLAPAEALAAARMTLPLGTRLAAGTLRTLARTQVTAPGPRCGLIPDRDGTRASTCRPPVRGRRPRCSSRRFSRRPAGGVCPTVTRRNCCRRPNAV